AIPGESRRKRRLCCNPRATRVCERFRGLSRPARTSLQNLLLRFNSGRRLDQLTDSSSVKYDDFHALAYAGGTKHVSRRDLEYRPYGDFRSRQVSLILYVFS